MLQGENTKLKQRLDEELDEAATREAVRSNFGFLQDVWDGKVKESSRYKVFQQGGAARHGLLYHMITHPFSDSHLDWVMDEINVSAFIKFDATVFLICICFLLQQKWMPTVEDQNKHSDFVWKVLLAEAFIKIYQDKFNMERSEAERRIANTPDVEDDDGDEL